MSMKEKQNDELMGILLKGIEGFLCTVDLLLSLLIIIETCTGKLVLQIDRFN